LRRQSGFLICFTGIDGSGKTTHAKSLVGFLNKRGYACIYVWAASRPILSLIFFAITRVLGYWKTTKKNMYTDPLEFAPYRMRSKLGLIWRLLLFTDFQIKVLATTKPLLARGRVVICDRYIYDIVMELQQSKLYTTRFGRCLSKTVPRPLITFLMDIPESIAGLRRGIPVEELSARRELFLRLAETYDFIIVDSTKDFSENQRKIRNRLWSRLESVKATR